jgi:diguanylate cyclase (GGDEF)-like protein
VRLAERLRSSVEEASATHGDQTVSVTISAGCASLNCCKEETTSAIVDTADQRIYEAKRLGRNRVAWA